MKKTFMFFFFFIVSVLNGMQRQIRHEHSVQPAILKEALGIIWKRKNEKPNFDKDHFSNSIHIGMAYLKVEEIAFWLNASDEKALASWLKVTNAKKLTPWLEATNDFKKACEGVATLDSIALANIIESNDLITKIIEAVEYLHSKKIKNPFKKSDAKTNEAMERNNLSVSLPVIPTSDIDIFEQDFDPFDARSDEEEIKNFAKKFGHSL